MAIKLHQRFNAINGTALFVIFLGISLALISFYYREAEDGALHQAQSTFSGLMVPFKYVGGVVGSGTEATATAYENSKASEETLEALRAQNEYLKNELIKFEEYRQEAIRLEGLLNIQSYYSLDTVTARVISRSMNAWERTVSIDKGERDGIIAGYPVMSATGVVGQVISTTPTSSEVRLLTDSQSGVAVIIQSSRAEGIVRGSLEGLLFLESVDADVKVVVGDVVVTSGLGGSYFRGLTVGIVVKVDENQGGSSRTIVVSPNASTGPLEEVLVAIRMHSEGDVNPPPVIVAPEATGGSGSVVED
ncbi:MAG: rod shape-determining protein MreC [Eggerthellaceae bacterium]|nr:rod shape-determining protein MreC [Eggerthellaceae bacterium]